VSPKRVRKLCGGGSLDSSARTISGDNRPIAAIDLYGVALIGYCSAVRSSCVSLAQYDCLAARAERHLINWGCAVQCLEQRRLLQLYEAALRRWGQVCLPTQLEGERAYLAEQVRQRTLEERNNARGRLESHRQHCPVCRGKRPNSVSEELIKNRKKAGLRSV
jgi:hypothetical protein